MLSPNTIGWLLSMALTQRGCDDYGSKPSTAVIERIYTRGGGGGGGGANGVRGAVYCILYLDSVPIPCFRDLLVLP